MSVKATIAPGYRFRLILMTVLMIGFGLYCVYDATVAYPLSRDIGAAYEQLKADHPVDFPERWPDHARSLDYPPKVPTKPKTDKDILTQWIMAAIVMPAGLFFGFKLLQESRRWVAMDAEQGLTASGGHAAPWDSLKGLERSRWKTKGIARVIYHDAASGRDRQILLDDFKSDRAAVGQIYKEVVARVYPEEVSEEAETQGVTAPDGPEA